MKFYIETASGISPDCLSDGLASFAWWKENGFELTPANYQYKANPDKEEVYTQLAFTIELGSLDDLIRLADLLAMPVDVEWQSKFRPAKPRQHIPVLRIMDAEF